MAHHVESLANVREAFFIRCYDNYAGRYISSSPQGFFIVTTTTFGFGARAMHWTVFFMKIYFGLACLVFALCSLSGCGGGNAIGSPSIDTGPANAPIHTLSAPQVSLTPTSLSFAAYVGSVSATAYATLSNTGNASLSISSITSTCSLTYCFYESNNCGTNLIAGASCSIGVRFRSSIAGSFTGTLAVHDNASGSPQTVALSGRTICVGVGGQCYSGHPCCPGLRCVPFSTRAYCEPALLQTAQSYLPRPAFTRFTIVDAVSVVNAKTKALMRTIPVGPEANAIAITPDGKKIYITDAHTNSVAVIDARRNIVEKTIAVGIGEGPTDVAVSADGRVAYVSNALQKNVSVIDTANDTLVKIMQHVDAPENVPILRRCSPGIVSSPDGSTAFVIAIQPPPYTVLDLALM